MKKSLTIAIALLALVIVSAAHAGTTERVSVAATGTQANQASTAPAISADGRGVAQAGEASARDTATGAYRVTVSGTVMHSWTLGWTERASDCTTTGNGSGSESIRFQSPQIRTLNVSVRGRRVWVMGYASGPVKGSIMRQGDFTLAGSGTGCSEVRTAPKEGCGTVDFSGTTGKTGYYFGGRGSGSVLIFNPRAIRAAAPTTQTCVSSVVPDGGAQGFCCQIDDPISKTLSDTYSPLRPRGSTKNRFRLTGRGAVKYPLLLGDRDIRAGTITVTYKWTALFTRAARGSGR